MTSRIRIRNRPRSLWRKYRLICYLLSTLFVLCAEERIEAANDMSLEFYVAPNGKDSNKGTKDAPFARLEQARDAVRQAIKNGVPAGGITVYLRQGIYRFSSTFELGKEDSGAA